MSEESHYHAAPLIATFSQMRGNPGASVVYSSMDWIAASNARAKQDQMDSAVPPLTESKTSEHNSIADRLATQSATTKLVEIVSDRRDMVSVSLH
jgi:hypothetical protein